MQIFSWQGTASGTAATLASAATAWATSQTWTAGDVRSTAAGGLFGCTKGGAGATTGTGPSGDGGGILDGESVWESLARARRVVVINADASAGLYVGGASVTTSSGGYVAPGGGGRDYAEEDSPGGIDPHGIYLAGSGAFSVEAYL